MESNIDNNECECWYGIQDWESFLLKNKKQFFNNELCMVHIPKEEIYGLYYVCKQNPFEEGMKAYINFCPYCGRLLNKNYKKVKTNES